MPLEIKELNIRISVSDTNQAPASQSSTDAGAGPHQPDPLTVQACVEKVLEILRTRTER